MGKMILTIDDSVHELLRKVFTNHVSEDGTQNKMVSYAAELLEKAIVEDAHKRGMDVADA